MSSEQQSINLNFQSNLNLQVDRNIVAPAMSLDVLKVQILTNQPIAIDRFKRTIEENDINYNFFLDIVNPDGTFQLRLLCFCLVLVALISLQFTQIVYLFVPPEFACRNGKADNLVIQIESNHQLLSDQDSGSNLVKDHTEDFYYVPKKANHKAQCTQPDDGKCQDKIIFQNAISMENATNEFQLYCQKRPMRTIIKILVFVFGFLGAGIAALFQHNYKRIVLFFLGMFSISVFLYSVPFFNTPIVNNVTTNKHLHSTNEYNVIQQQQQQHWEPYAYNNLIDFKQVGIYLQQNNILTFVCFYIASSFSGFGLLIFLLSYLRDFFNDVSRISLKTNLFLSMAMAQLFETLLKLVVVDWRVYNMFVIAIPSFLLLIIGMFLIKENPKDLLNRIQSLNIELSKNSIKNQALNEDIRRNIVDLQEKSFLTFNAISQSNQSPFLTKEQFLLTIERFLFCQSIKKETTSLPINLIRPAIGITFIMSVLIIIYLSPFFLIQTIGTGITFNMFCYALAEILGVLMTIRFMNLCFPLKTIKYNLLISGIIGFTITFAKFNDHCESGLSVCPRKMIELLIVCQLRFFLVFTLFLLYRQVQLIITDERQRFKLLSICSSFALFGSTIPLLMEYTNVNIEKFYIIVSMLAITASWATKLLK